MKAYIRILTFALLCGVTTQATARSIDWGGAVGDSLFDSGGNILDSTYIFEMGSFGSSFIPSELNMDLWLSNWKVFDRAIEGNGWNSTDQFIASSANLLLNGTSSESPPLPSNFFAQGEQGYIWAYKANQTYAAGLEWALITNNSLDGNSANDWLFPAHSDQTGLPLQWRLSTASTPIFGGLNDLSGAGDYSSTPALFDLQTATTVVPEPGSALLVAVCGFLIQLRRRRGMKVM